MCKFMRRPGRHWGIPCLSCLPEICAGAGGQSLGMEQADFSHVAAVELDPDGCETLRPNRPRWKVAEGDVHQFAGRPYRGVALLAGGVPCPPFTVAGKQLGADDERDLFRRPCGWAGMRAPCGAAGERPGAFDRAVRWLPAARSGAARAGLRGGLAGAERVGLRCPAAAAADRAGRDEPSTYAHFEWPSPSARPRPSARPCMISWPQMAGTARQRGPGRPMGSAPPSSAARRSTAGRTSAPRGPRGLGKLGVDGKGLADEPPGADAPAAHMPRLTLPMAAAIQGCPQDWGFYGLKTAAYRQIGNAFPPPVAGRSAQRSAGPSRPPARRRPDGRAFARRLSLP